MAQTIGKIITLFISSSKTKTRLEKENLHLNTKGIIEDKYYNRDIQRSILITSTQSYDLVKNKNISIPFGVLGENLLIDYNPYHLVAGVKLQIGENVILEISQHCTMCEHLSNIDTQLPTLLKDNRGIFAKVLQEGKIKREDEIILL